MNPLAGWTISRHARERMRERRVPVDHVVDSLRSRHTLIVEIQPDGNHCYWSFKYGIAIVVSEDNKTIITVLLSGADKYNWQAIAAERDPEDPGMSLEALEAMAEPDRKGVKKPEGLAPKRRPGQPRTASKYRKAEPVTTTSVYAGFSDRMLGIAKELLKAHGLPEDDLSRIKVVRPGVLEVDLPRD